MEYLQLFAQEGQVEVSAETASPSPPETAPAQGEADRLGGEDAAVQPLAAPSAQEALSGGVGEEATLRAHFDSLQRQANDLRRQFPDFDLGRALEDPVFLRLTAPGIGVSLEDAYYATHRNQLRQNIAQAARSRPQENGTGAAAPAVTAFDYRHASAQQREELKKAIRAAKARGEKLYPRG